MNTRIRSIATVAASATAALMLAACAPSMTKPDGAQSARDKLNELQADSRLAPLVPVATVALDGRSKCHCIDGTPLEAHDILRQGSCLVRKNVLNASQIGDNCTPGKRASICNVVIHVQINVDQP